MKGVILFLAMTTGSSTLCYAQCDDETLIGNHIAGILPGPDGLIHVAYQYATTDITQTPHVQNNNPNPPANIVTEVQNAVTEWNQYKSITGVVFEAAPPGSAADLAISLDNDPDENGGCIAGNQVNANVNYSSTFQNAASASGAVSLFSTGIAHELGHLLGLNDSQDSSSIMKHSNGTCSAPIVAGARACSHYRLAFC
jgi:hypothetical protein